MTGDELISRVRAYLALKAATERLEDHLAQLTENSCWRVSDYNDYCAVEISREVAMRIFTEHIAASRAKLAAEAQAMGIE